MTKRLSVGIFLIAVSAVVAAAQFTTAEDAIKYRKAVMVMIVHHFGSMAAAVKGEAAYDPAEFSAHAASVEMLAAMAWDAFMTPGSDRGDTQLKAVALKEPAKFMTAADAFETETARLAAAADSGDLNKIKPQFAAVAQSCSNCHKRYRK